MGLNIDDLKQAVLTQDDFAHELRIGEVPWLVRQLLPLNLTIEHGGTYTDSTSGKPRQFDYRFRFIKESETRGSNLAIFIAAECKNLSSESPMLVSGVERRLEEAYYTLIESTYNPIFPQSNFRPVRVFHNKSLYCPGAFVGKNVLRPKLKSEKGKPDKIECGSDSDIYDRWAQSLASAIELAHNATEIAAVNKLNMVRSIVLPIVVVPDGSLLTLMYNPDGTVKGDIENAEECTFFIGREVIVGRSTNRQSFHFSHIHFMTIRGFTNLISNFYNHEHFWRNWFPERA